MSMNIKAGDIVVRYSGGRRPLERVTVSRVGTKYFYVVRGHWEDAFHLSDGKAKTGPSYVKTLAQVAEADHRESVMDTLRRHGVVLEWKPLTRLSTEHLEALAAVAVTFPVADDTV